MRTTALAALCVLSPLVSANPAPAYPGYQLLWSDAFSGSAGNSPDPGRWNTVTGVHTNHEVESYTTSNQNLQISGGGTVQLVPRKVNGQWTSARIETKATFTPAAGKITMFEASIRFGSNAASQKQGIWPAFWLLGDAIHQGTSWPRCGELDIMETVNGLPTGYGTLHCGNSNSGGPCNEPNGRGGAVGLADDGWHTWSLQVDRTNAGGAWTGEVVRWLLDGREYFTVSGAQIGDQAIWATLAHSPLFMILNIAVGGDWPGAPNGATADGYGSMMEVEYVAAYSS